MVYSFVFFNFISDIRIFCHTLVLCEAFWFNSDIIQFGSRDLHDPFSVTLDTASTWDTIGCVGVYVCVVHISFVVQILFVVRIVVEVRILLLMRISLVDWIFRISRI